MEKKKSEEKSVKSGSIDSDGAILDKIERVFNGRSSSGGKRWSCLPDEQTRRHFSRA